MGLEETEGDGGLESGFWLAAGKIIIQFRHVFIMGNIYIPKMQAYAGGGDAVPGLYSLPVVRRGLLLLVVKFNNLEVI